MDLSVMLTVGGVILLTAGIVIYILTRKKSDKLARRAFINQCRFAIDQHQFAVDDFGKTAIYRKLRPDLKRSLRRQLDVDGVPSGAGDHIKRDLLEALARLEKKWGI
jgi:hypothetical protein